MGPFRSLFRFIYIMGPYNSLHLLMRPYGLIWDLISLYKAFCVLIGPY